MYYKNDVFKFNNIFSLDHEKVIDIAIIRSSTLSFLLNK